VAFVDCAAGCAGADGSPAHPYCEAQSGVDAGRPYVALTPHDSAGCSYPAFQIANRTVQIVGRGARVRASGGRDALTISGGDVAVLDLDLSFASPSPPDGARNGLYAVGCSHLTLDHLIAHDMGAYASGNLYDGVRVQGIGDLVVRSCLFYGNRGWGLSVQDARFSIENTYVLANGTDGAPLLTSGGVLLGDNAVGSFVFNTVAFNQAGPLTPDAGIHCTAAATLTSTLVVFNDATATPGSCTLVGSIQTSDLAGALPEELFVDPANPAATFARSQGAHLLDGDVARSHVLARGAPRAPSDPEIDFDGDARPTAPTPGADEP
jgi:hypothetical protein